MEAVVIDTATGQSVVARPSQSAVSWGAITAGTVAAVATAVILSALGAGLGLTGLSPWWNTGMSAKALGVGAIIWMIVVQWLSAALGGYLTGRLRTQWLDVPEDEVFFR